MVSFLKCMKGICPNHVLEPLCPFASPQPHEKPKTMINSGAWGMLQLPVYTGEAELHLSEISLQCRVSTDGQLLFLLVLYKHFLAYMQLSRNLSDIHTVLGRQQDT